MRYKIIYLPTNEFVSDSFIVTQDGEIASWDESQGWSSLFINQKDYSVQITIDVVSE